MATLYVENVPDDLYEALRERARKNKRSIAAEVVTLLADRVPTAAELARRNEAVKGLLSIRSKTARGKFPPIEEWLREDRER